MTWFGLAGPLFNVSFREYGGGQMSGTIFLLLGLAALAVYTGIHWERARRAVFDVRLGRKRVNSLRQTAAKERTHTALLVTGSMMVFFMIVKYG